MMKPRMTFLLTLCAISALSGCELLRTGSFRVLSWSPGAGVHENVQELKIELTFSHEPDTDSIEDNFSLTEDSVICPGRFVWEDRTLEFVPDYPLKTMKDYKVRIAKSASSTGGLSLDDDIELRFTTRTASDRPLVTSCVPIGGGSAAAPDAPIVLQFSCAIDHASLIQAFSVTPSVSGLWTFDDANRSAAFAPLQEWDSSLKYQVKVSKSLKSVYGKTMQEEYAFWFNGGTDQTLPTLLSAEALRTDDSVALVLVSYDPLAVPNDPNGTWEDTWKLRFTFSEPVSFAILDSKVLCEGGPPLVRETTGDSGAMAVYKFSQPVTWMSIFMVKVNAGIVDLAGNKSTDVASYRILVDGLGSRPPEVLAVRFPRQPAVGPAYDAVVWTLADSWGSMGLDITYYPTGSATRTWFELFIRVAAGSTLDFMSMMESFRIEATNGAASFVLTKIVTSGFAITDPPPGYEGADIYRVQIVGDLTPYISPGVVKLTVTTSLQDSGGRKLPQLWQLPLIK